MLKYVIAIIVGISICVSAFLSVIYLKYGKNLFNIFNT